MDIVYIETSVISHATARPSMDTTTLALQQQAKRWLADYKQLYEVVTSQLVLDEASLGDSDAARRRLEALNGIPVLPANPDVDSIADEIIRRHMMPAKARLDALHVASAALAGVQYLLTQNCTHIANATELPRIYKLLNELGLSGMLVCAPIDFFGGT
jgi:predicted nucleic acid-binding protein